MQENTKKKNEMEGAKEGKNDKLEDTEAGAADDPENDEENTQFLCFAQKPSAKSYVVFLVAIASLFMNVWKIVYAIPVVSALSKGFLISSSLVSFIPGVFGVINEYKMIQGDSFRAALNKLRGEVDRFAGENEKLSASVDELEMEVDRLKDVEEGLVTISEAQGENVGNLVELVKENKIIQVQLREVLKSRAVEDVVALVMAIDQDGNFELDSGELDRLMIGLSNIESFEIDEEEFRKVVMSQGGSVNAVLDLIKGLLD